MKKALEGTDNAAIKAASEKLTEVSYEAFGKIYQQQAQEAAQQQQQAGPQAGGSSAPHDDNVVDADYEVVDDNK